MDEAEVLNKIERKLRKGEATKKEMNILMGGYVAHGVPIPKDIRRLLK
jgi:hypothetical protein